MQTLAENPGDGEILKAVEAWVDRLVVSDFSGAIEMTDHDSYYGWTPDNLREVIEGYGLPEHHPRGSFRVTAPATNLRTETVAMFVLESWDGARSHPLSGSTG
jgi:hypothetical protein